MITKEINSNIINTLHHSSIQAIIFIGKKLSRQKPLIFRINFSCPGLSQQTRLSELQGFAQFGQKYKKGHPLPRHATTLTSAVTSPCSVYQQSLDAMVSTTAGSVRPSLTCPTKSSVSHHLFLFAKFYSATLCLCLFIIIIYLLY